MVYGQTTISGGDITVVPGAPFITESLTQKISQAYVDDNFVKAFQLQNNTYTYGNDVGSVNAVEVTNATPFGAYVAGTEIKVKVQNTSTGALTLNVDGQGAAAVQVLTPIGLTACTGGEVIAGGIYTFIYNGTTAQLLNPSVLPVLYSKVSFSSAQTQALPGANLTTPIKVNYSTVVSDTQGWWDGVNFRFKPTIPGRFNVSAKNSFVSTSGSNTSSLSLYLNGSIYEGLDEEGVADTILAGVASISLNGTTDYVEIFAGSTGTAILGHNALVFVGNASNNNVFEIQYIGN